MRRQALAAMLVICVAAGASSPGFARPDADPYTLTGPTSEASAWKTPGAGFTWGGGAGSVTETYKGNGAPETATLSWKLPSSISADGSKGTLTLVASAGGEVWAPGFQINGVLVGCSGIKNTPSYGTGCAEGDHAAIATSLQPGKSASVTQEFLIKPGLGKVTVVVPGFSQQFVYNAAKNSAGGTSSGSGSSEPQVVYSVSSRIAIPGTKTALHFTASGNFHLTHVPSANATAAGFGSHGTAAVQITTEKGTYTLGLAVKSVAFEKEGATRVVVTYRVTRSGVGCAKVGSTFTVTATDDGARDSIELRGLCSVNTDDFTSGTTTVSVKVK